MPYRLAEVRKLTQSGPSKLGSSLFTVNRHQGDASSAFFFVRPLSTFGLTGGIPVYTPLSFRHFERLGVKVATRRNTREPTVSAEPTMWKTSLPMSMPIEAKGDMVVSMGCFSGASV
jgi:hypothetical protein